MRVGPKMMIVLEVVGAQPGSPKIVPALAAEPYPWKGMRGGLAYGYRSVNRAIDRGLVQAERGSGSAWSLTLTDAGRQALATAR